VTHLINYCIEFCKDCVGVVIPFHTPVAFLKIPVKHMLLP